MPLDEFGKPDRRFAFQLKAHRLKLGLHIGFREDAPSASTSLFATGAGKPAGADTPTKFSATSSGSPSSTTVGSSGASATRLDEVTERWGVKVTNVEIREIIPPREITDAMNRQMTAERIRRALAGMAIRGDRTMHAPPLLRAQGRHAP